MAGGYSGVSDELMRAADLSYSSEEKSFIDTLANQQRDQWGSAASTLYSTKLLERALIKHAAALIKAADASDRYASRLVTATWALVAVTVVLALATIALIFR